MDLRTKISTILGFRVEPHDYKAAFDKIDTAGLPSRKQVNAILVAILEKLDETNPSL